MLCPRCKKDKRQQNWNKKLKQWLCPECNDDVDGVKSPKLEKNKR